MIKFAIAFHRKEGMDHDECMKHWREKHAPLCLGIAELRVHCRGYLQNDLVHGGRDDHPSGLTTAWFDDVASIFEHFAIPDYMSIIRPDELSFSRHDNALVAIGEERIVVPGGTSGQTRLFRFLRAKSSGAGMAEFRAREYGPRIAEASGNLGILRFAESMSVPVDLPFPPEQIFDGLDEFIFETPDAVQRFLSWETDLLSQIGAAEYIDEARSEIFTSSATRQII